MTYYVYTVFTRLTVSWAERESSGHATSGACHVYCSACHVYHVSWVSPSPFDCRPIVRRYFGHVDTRVSDTASTTLVQVAAAI